MRKLCVIIIMLCGWIHADTSIWSSGTAHSLPKGQWEVGLFQPLRYGMTDDQDIALHPLIALKLPNLVYKKTWEEKKQLDHCDPTWLLLSHTVTAIHHWCRKIQDRRPPV